MCAPQSVYGVVYITRIPIQFQMEELCKFARCAMPMPVTLQEVQLVLYPEVNLQWYGSR